MLETDRCLLTKLCEGDFDEVKLLYINEDVRKYLGGTVSDDVVRTKFDKLLNSNKSNDLYLVVRHKRTSEFIGLVSLDTHHDGVSTEVSYQLLPQWWGCGYATEVLQKVIQYAFDDLALTHLIAETQSANKASCRLLESLGMKVSTTIKRFGAEQKIYYLKT